MQLYLAPWTWYTASRMSYWQAPNLSACKGLVDLRSLPQMAKAGGIPEGYGLFVYPDLQSSIGSYLIGTEKDSLSTTAKHKIKQALGLTSDIISIKPLNILWELLTQHADITGLIRWKPLRPDIDLKLKLYLGGFSLIKEERFDPNGHPLVLPALREGYRKIRQEGLATNSDHYKRILSSWEAKYHLPYQTFIPADLPDEGKLPRETTYGDTFVETNDTDLTSHTATGPNGGWAWSEPAGDIDVIGSNDRARGMTSPAEGQCTSNLDSDDHYAQANLYSTGQNADLGVVCRYESVTQFDFYLVIDQEASVRWALYKRLNAVYTLIDSETATWATSEGSLFKVKADGSAISGHVDDVEKLTATDTAIVNNLRGGIISFGDINEWDNFEAADLGAAAAFIPKVMFG